MRGKAAGRTRALERKREQAAVRLQAEPHSPAVSGASLTWRDAWADRKKKREKQKVSQPASQQYSQMPFFRGREAERCLALGPSFFCVWGVGVGQGEGAWCG